MSFRSLAGLNADSARIGYEVEHGRHMFTDQLGRAWMEKMNDFTRFQPDDHDSQDRWLADRMNRYFCYDQAHQEVLERVYSKDLVTNDGDAGQYSVQRMRIEVFYEKLENYTVARYSEISLRRHKAWRELRARGIETRVKGQPRPTKEDPDPEPLLDIDHLNIGRVWMHSKYRNTVLGTVVDPREEPDQDAYTKARFNLFPGFRRGFSRADVAGFVAWNLLMPIMVHLRFVVCGSDEELGQLLAWMAHLVQYPHVKTELAQVLQGAQGLGKSTVFKYLVYAMGNWASTVTRMSELAGQWTNLVHGKGLVLVDDADMNSLPAQDIANLRTMITADIERVRVMNKDPTTQESFVNFAICGNPEHMINDEGEMRRFSMHEVKLQPLLESPMLRYRFSDDIAKRKELYFKWVHSSMTARQCLGLKTLMNFLYRYPLEGYERSARPKNEILALQRYHSMNPMKKWWVSQLLDPDSTDGCFGQRDVTIQSLFSRFQQTLDGPKSRFSKYYFSRTILPLVPNADASKPFQMRSQTDCREWLARKEPGMDALWKRETNDHRTALPTTEVVDVPRFWREWAPAELMGTPIRALLESGAYGEARVPSAESSPGGGEDEEPPRKRKRTADEVYQEVVDSMTVQQQELERQLEQFRHPDYWATRPLAVRWARALQWAQHKKDERMCALLSRPCPAVLVDEELENSIHELCAESVL